MAEVIHVCNGGEQAVKDTHTVASMAALDSWKGKEVNAWLVFAHLTWDGQKLSQNYGFDMALRIRTVLQSKAPIIVYSPIALAYFKQLKGVKYKQLHGPGIGFLETPSTLIKFEKVLQGTTGLTKTSFHDVRTMLCDLRGLVVDQMSHNLRWGRGVEAELERIGTLLGAEEKTRLNFQANSQSILAAVEENNRTEFDRLKDELYKACNKLIPRVQGGTGEAGSSTNRRYKVLVLDDDYEDSMAAQKALSDSFDLTAVRTSKEALQALDEDKERNHILAVVCDWRLYEYIGRLKTDDWQVPQGYDVLEHAAKHGIRSLFAITGQDEQLVDEMRNISGIRYSLFKKKHLASSEQWNVMCDVLKNACRSAIRSRSNILTGGRWTNVIDGRSLRDDYIQAWNGLDWEITLAEWSELATEAYMYAMDAKSNCVIDRYGDLTVGQHTRDLRAFMVMRRVMLGMYYQHAGLFTGDMIWRKTYQKIWSGNAEDSLTTKLHLHAIKKNAVSGRHFLPEERHWLNALHNLNLDDEGTDAQWRE